MIRSFRPSVSAILRQAAVCSDYTRVYEQGRDKRLANALRRATQVPTVSDRR